MLIVFNISNYCLYGVRHGAVEFGKPTALLPDYDSEIFVIH
jgi:hypothetical protein